VARSGDVPAYLVNDFREIKPDWLEGVERVGITSGASAPERLVQETADYFKRQGAEVTNIGFVEENVHFALPPEIAGMP
jgi:4-hydroxy-3-methylbut-2-enyl diphosphate reductase